MVKRVLNKLKNDIRYRDQLDHVEVLPLKDAIYGKVDNLPHNIQNYLNKSGIKLYEHQGQSLEHIRKKQNVIITTPTASGKTFAFNLPIFEGLNQDPNATALYIYPAKALANDQLKTLIKLEKEFKIKVSPNIYDGDTEKSKRPWIRENSRIVLTNPYELHLILSWNHLWAKFYKNLKYVVIDEAHQYRGVFGSNVALLIRRFRRICNYYGSDPQFILSSATLANPIEFGEKLTGLPFKLISKDGSPKGRKYFVFYNPYFDGKGKLSTHQETKNLFLFFITNNLQTLCFTISRKMAELIAKWAKTEIDETKPEFTERITAYRAGYLAEERRKIENDLKNEELAGVTATNALELGINIGSLDAVIISGYPGTVMSTWQQAGRAGRGMNDSLVLLIAFENPLDQYLMKHPESFFDKPHEHAIIDLENPYILSGHIMCASSEIPLKIEEIGKYFGKDNEAFLDNLKKLGLVKKTSEGWKYSGKGNAAFNVGLKNISSSTFKVMNGKKLLETMERQQAYREAHEGAVLINKGEAYLVEGFNLKNHIINVVKKDVDYHTQTMKSIEIMILSTLNKKTIGNLIISYGDLEVSEDYYKYKAMHYDKTIGNYKLELPPIKFKTKGLWFSIPDSLKKDLEKIYPKEEAFEGGLHGTEHAMIAMTPFHIMCDHFDLGGVSTPKHPDTGMAAIFVYDAFSGGIGLTEKAVDLFEEILKRTYELVRDCNCDNGCPACIYSPKCGNDNKPLSKKGTLFILSNILKLMGTKIKKEHTTHSSVIEQVIVEENSNLEQESNLKIISQELSTLLNKGIFFEENDNPLEAIKFYDKALKIEPENPLILYNKGVSLLNAGKCNETIKHAQKCIDINSKDYDAWYLLGASFQYLENYNKAIACYKEVLDIFPEHEDAKEYLNLLSELQRKNEKVNNENKINKEEYQEIIKDLFNHPDGNKRAEAAYKLGETRDSQFVEVLCLALEDRNGNVRRLGASALGKIGDPKAIEALTNLLNDEKPQVRQYAVKALGYIGDKKALPYLEQVKDDPIYYVEKAVNNTIKKINGEKL